MSLDTFSTSEISDALIDLGVPHGGLIPDLQLFSPQTQRLCGPAHTVQIAHISEPVQNAPKEHFVDTVQPGHVIVVSSPPHVPNAVWGGLMTAGAQARRAAGVVVIGRVRDLAEHRAAGFPLFARGRSTLPQRAFTRVAAVGCPLDIPITTGATGEGATISVHIEPGDWMIGDDDGVVCVPCDMVERVVQRASAAREVDERCLKDIKDGLGVRESFRKHRGK